MIYITGCVYCLVFKMSDTTQLFRAALPVELNWVGLDHVFVMMMGTDLVPET
jgi:hypothetical protein